MTIAGFARKYEVPITYATLASYSVRPVATMERDVDFPEHEMYLSLLNVLATKTNKAKTTYENLERMYQRVRNVYG